MTEKSDIYSFGIVLWEIFSQRVPFSHLADTDVVTLFPEIACRALRPQMPLLIEPRLKALIECCWTNEPTERPTADQLVKILKTFVSNMAESIV